MIAFRQIFGYPLAVHHQLVALFQLLVLPGHKLGLLNLLQLELRQGLLLCLGFLVQRLFLQGLLQFPAFPVGCLHRLRRLLELLAAVGVQNLHMFLLVQKGLVLMLAMDVNQQLRQLLHLFRRDRLPVHTVDILPHLHLPAYDHRAIFLRFQLQQFFPHPLVAACEYQLHQGALRPFSQHFTVEFPSQGQVHASNQQGLARAGLSGQDIQASSELHLGLFHQSQILHM